MSTEMAGKGASNPINILEYAQNWSYSVPWGESQNSANRLRRPRTLVEFQKNSEQDDLILADILAMCLAPGNNDRFDFRVRWFSEIARCALGYVTQEEEDEYERRRDSSWQQESRGGTTNMERSARGSTICYDTIVLSTD